MPKLNIEMFETPPKEGDKVKVIGVVKSIDPESGDVEVSYDEVSKVENVEGTEEVESEEYDSSDDSLDGALEKAFPKTQ